MEGLHKRFKIVRTDNQDDILEEFSTMEAAEQLMIILQSKGENVMIKTDDEDIEDTPDSFDIEGLDLEQPEVEFGSDLDVFNEGGFGDLEVDDDANEVDFE